MTSTSSPAHSCGVCDLRLGAPASLEQFAVVIHGSYTAEDVALLDRLVGAAMLPALPGLHSSSAG